MTAWFKRTRPETPPVVQDLTEAGEEAPAAFLARLAIECTHDLIEDVVKL